MDLSLAALFLAFALLAAVSRRRWFTPVRLRQDSWIIDLTGLVAQGVIVPLVQVFLLAALMRGLWPSAAGQLEIPGIVAFLLSFTLVDYLYYWNHRLLHTKTLWPLHLVHHTAESLDVWVTARNSLWTPLFIVYLWTQAVLVFFLKDPAWLLWGVAASNALDLWRHSGLDTPAWVRRLIGSLFILPEDHEWHHSRDRHGINFGANLNLWDRLHGTFQRDQVRPAELGVRVHGSLFDRLFIPWRMQ